MAGTACGDGGHTAGEGIHGGIERARGAHGATISPKGRPPPADTSEPARAGLRRPGAARSPVQREEL
ncbi:hypothetical protein [Candidatus Frankia alpina]|uniref:hypothetical protein n=1 Tax=Candidatus Frankia alpina TaxID=2699483 RepID=UPI0013CF6CBC|nr:hypothetical protein [Candidatus Frankia alpina]